MPLELTDAGGSYVLEHFVIEADGPLQAYHTMEIFGADFGGDLFHPTVDGSRVGKQFTLQLPTLTPNNRLFVTALEPAQVELRDAAGTLLSALNLGPRQWWEPDADPAVSLLAGEVYLLSSTGDLTVQSSSVTGTSVVPPADAALAALGDVGTSFVFSTRTRDAGGGAVAIFAYDDADYRVLAGGAELFSGRLAAGDFAFHVGVGEQRALQLLSTGPVTVLAGHLARSGASTIELLGEDVVQQLGDGAVEFLVHSQAQQVGDSVVLAGSSGAALRVDGQPFSLPPFGTHSLADGALYRIPSSHPVVVQTQGGDDRYYDSSATSSARSPTRPGPPARSSTGRSS